MGLPHRQDAYARRNGKQGLGQACICHRVQKPAAGDFRVEYGRLSVARHPFGPQVVRPSGDRRRARPSAEDTQDGVPEDRSGRAEGEYQAPSRGLKCGHEAARLMELLAPGICPGPSYLPVSMAAA